jgi:GNAT superfamily N-acetyltransferase
MTGDIRNANNVGIRPPRPEDEAALAGLHERELSTEFISRLGPRFLRRYHRAFSGSPHATSLVAADEGTGEPVGFLLGTLDNAAHSAYLIRRHGPAMMVLILAQAIGDPKLTGELLKTRGWRYARAALRLSAKGSRRTSGRRASGRLKMRGAGEVGVLAHVAVRREYRGLGIGASLVSAFRAEAVQAGVQELELVTVPGRSGSGAFYERLGWSYTEERTSRGGERFSLYQLTPNDPGHANV